MLIKSLALTGLFVPSSLDSGPEIKADARLLEGLHLVSSSLLGPVDPSFRALSGRFTVSVRRHRLTKILFLQIPVGQVVVIIVDEAKVASLQPLPTALPSDPTVGLCLGS